MNRGEAGPRDAKVIVRDFVVQDLDENQMFRQDGTRPDPSAKLLLNMTGTKKNEWM